MAKKKNSANYRISGAPSTSSSILPLALSSDEHMTISTLETWLWDAACAIRGATDAPKFKDFILPLIFYKRLSDVFDDECRQYVDHFGDEELAGQFIKEDHRRSLAEGHAPIVRFYIPDEYRWIHLRNHPADSHLGEFVTDAMRKVADLHVFPALDRLGLNEAMTSFRVSTLFCMQDENYSFQRSSVKERRLFEAVNCR